MSSSTVMAPLRDIITRESRRAGFAAAHAFAATLATRYGADVRAVLFYGSCLRQATDEGLMLDFYVLVDDLAHVIANPISRLFAQLLPPNVYYHEMLFDGRTLRAKVAVMTLARFCQDVGPGRLTASIWARFSQPALVLWADGDDARLRAERALATAVATMIDAALPLMERPFSARDLWVRAVSETYGAELRPESAGKAASLVDADRARYEQVTQAYLGPATADGFYAPRSSQGARAAAGRAWVRRRILGKTLNVLRLVKAAFTFSGGLDYAVWKIERHSGVKIALTERQRRHPIITGLWLLPRLLKRGGIK